MLPGAPLNKSEQLESKEKQEKEPVGYSHYNFIETAYCAKCGEQFVIIHRKRVGSEVFKQAGRRRIYCYSCSPPHNTKTRF